MTDQQRYIEMTAAFLRASEERRLEDAEAFLAHDVTFVFPGAVHRKLADVHAAAAGHYLAIRKSFVAWDVASRADGSTVVFSTGTLSGKALDGVEFEGIRYVDRFTWRDDRIVLQEVWNDLAISGVLRRRPT